MNETAQGQDYRAYVSTLPLIEALWWFIEENGALEQELSTEIFFALRARYRTEYQSCQTERVTIEDAVANRCANAIRHAYPATQGLSAETSMVSFLADAMQFAKVARFQFDRALTSARAIHQSENVKHVATDKVAT